MYNEIHICIYIYIYMYIPVGPQRVPVSSGIIFLSYGWLLIGPASVYILPVYLLPASGGALVNPFAVRDARNVM